MDDRLSGWLVSTRSKTFVDFRVTRTNYVLCKWNGAEHARTAGPRLAVSVFRGYSDVKCIADILLNWTCTASPVVVQVLFC